MSRRRRPTSAYSKKNPPPLWADRRVRVEFEEGWTEVVDGWLMKPPPRAWLQDHYKIWSSYLAHRCENGDIRACTSIQVIPGKKKVGLYAYCSSCKAKLPERIKTMIRLAGIG